MTECFLCYSDGSVMDDIVNIAVAAEYSPCSVLGGGPYSPGSLTEAEQLKLAELKTANAAMMAPLSEDQGYKVGAPQ